MKLKTEVLHSGSHFPRYAGAVASPIFQSATFAQQTPESDEHPIRYIRLNNTPNHLLLNRRLAALEEGEAALVMSSGMAAISTTFLGLLKSGDHLLLQKHLYGGTYALAVNDLPRMGIAFDWVDLDRPESWQNLVKPNTRAFYTESISNPLMAVPDLAAVVAFCRTNRLYSIIDNTFASPVNFKPLPLGFDVVIHSATKYLNGHSDLVAGVVAASQPLIEKLLPVLNRFGGALDPHTCFLLERGIKTLVLRVAQQNESAQKIAGYLQEQPSVATVNYPGLPDHPAHGLARRFFKGYGGMLSFALRGDMPAREFVQRLKVITDAPSLGGVESLVSIPAETSHANMSARERAAMGISENLIRLSVGIEDVEDLIEDLGRALG